MPGDFFDPSPAGGGIDFHGDPSSPDDVIRVWRGGLHPVLVIDPKGARILVGDGTVPPATRLTPRTEVLSMINTHSVWLTTEVDLGPVPRSAGHFTISGTGLPVGRDVLVQQAPGPYTGKGTRADEAEMDSVSGTGHVKDDTTIEVFWGSAAGSNRVRGNFKFLYSVNGVVSST